MFFPASFLAAQNGCPGCLTDIPAIPEDTFYLSAIPDGQVGIYYDADLSFRLPSTTNNVPDAPPGLTIDQITISAITDLPPGLQWEANQTVFQPAVQHDGCVKMCGVPLLSDSFFITVHITAVVFGISQGATYVIPMYVAPALNNTVGFSIANSTGCGEVIADWTNNVPSNGLPGFTYAWNFGNGNQSVLENPPAQVYNAPGVYYITYQAIIDTAGYFLSGIQIAGAGCNDDIPPILTGAPDVYIRLFDPSGALILTSSTIENASFPTGFTINQYLDTGQYLVEVWDDDTFLGGGDDHCGSFIFDQNTAGLVQSNSLFLEFTILHPVQEVNSTDSVVVWEPPGNPLLDMPAEWSFCEGDSAWLSTNYTEGVTWFRDGIQIAASQGIWAKQTGLYAAQYTNANGCTSGLSNSVQIEVLPLPDVPAYVNMQNELTLFEPGNLPQAFQLQWYLDGVAMADETGPALCAVADGLYTLEVTDLATGCHHTFSTYVVVNPAYDCTVGVKPMIENDFRIFPNPAKNGCWLEGDPAYPVFLYNAQGQTILTLPYGDAAHPWVDLTGLPSGVYWLIDAAGKSKQLIRIAP